MSYALRHALELICAKTNPPYRPGTRPLSLAELGAAELDLSTTVLSGGYLRGLDLIRARLPTDLRFADLRGASLPSGQVFNDHGALKDQPSPMRPLGPVRGHAGSITSLAVLGDGRIVSGSDDNTVRIWREEPGEGWTEA